MSATPGYTLLIASYLEPEHVERISQVDQRVSTIYEPALLPPPRFPSDHWGQADFKRTPEQEARWRSLLQQADILFDFDYTNLDELPQLAPRLRWVQASSAGIGQLVRRQRYGQRMPQTVFTTASGIHAQPLAEFCVMAMLVFSRGLLRTLRDQQRRHWERYAGSDLQGLTLGIIGVGKIGREVARMARALGLRVIGTKRNTSGLDAAALALDELYPLSELDALLERSHYLVVVTPHTDETERLIGAAQLARLPQGAVIINIGRGAVIDEPALIEALRSGQLGGAALDVFAEEPLPVDSPLWELPNVIVSPHSASTSDRENQRLTELFCANLRRFLNNEPLQNVLDLELLY